MGIKIAFLDWYPGFNENHIYVRLLSRALGCRVKVTDLERAEIILVGPYGQAKNYLHKKPSQIIIYGSGENTRPDYRFCDLSLTLDICTYNGKNVRIPAWAGEFDFWGDFPNAIYSQAETEQILATNQPLFVGTFEIDKPLIAIFSTYEQNRISVLMSLENKFANISKVGKLWGNGEACRDSESLFAAKREFLRGYTMNLCFENSIAPGYVTEKILHARMAGCLALTYAHPSCNIDYCTFGLLNFHDYLDIESYVNSVYHLFQDLYQLEILRRSQVFARIPDVDLLVSSVQKALAPYLRQWV